MTNLKERLEKRRDAVLKNSDWHSFGNGYQSGQDNLIHIIVKLAEALGYYADSTVMLNGNHAQQALEELEAWMRPSTATNEGEK